MSGRDRPGQAGTGRTARRVWRDGAGRAGGGGRERLGIREQLGQEPGTPVYGGAPYGPFDNEKGTPASEQVIRADLAAASRPASR